MLTSLHVMAFTSFARILIIRSLNYNKMDHPLKWGHHTRRITITYYPEGSLENLLSKLPNLKITYFSSQEMFRIHKNSLRWAFPKGAVSKKIQQIILNRVPPNSEPDYLSICRSLRESITHLRKKYPNSDTIQRYIGLCSIISSNGGQSVGENMMPGSWCFPRLMLVQSWLNSSMKVIHLYQKLMLKNYYNPPHTSTS